MQIYDDFLPQDECQLLKEQICFNKNFPFYLHNYVALSDEETSLWNWYGTHVFYEDGNINSQYFEFVNEIFIPKFIEMGIFKSLIRIKANFYSNTNSMKEHKSHRDYNYPHNAAVYSLNTCDGFTRLESGDIINSVENRLVVFNGDQIHNSSTTTDQPVRFNLNFNFN